MLAGVLEQIVPKVLWHHVILEELFPARMLAKGTVEDVEWRVVVVVTHVTDVILHLHFNAVTLVVLAAFELLVAILLG